MGIRRQFIGFTGAVQILLTLVMFAMGSTMSDLALAQSLLQNDSSNSVALGVPLWGGIVILMCGAGNIVEAFTARSSRKRSYDLLPCSIGAFCANLIAFLASGIVIGLFAWAIYDVASTYVIMVSTVLASASIIFILSMLAMFVDCMTVCLGTGPSQPRPYFVDYDAPPARGGTVHGYKA